MSKTKIPTKVVSKLWLKAGGRCQLRGCNKPLWCDELTHNEINNALIAHIIADSPNGPRGNPELSPLLAKEFSNLMLLCPTCHKLVDNKATLKDYPVELLQEFKREHEARIENLTSISEAAKTHLLSFTDNIGDRQPSTNFDDARISVLPRYPAEARFIEIDLRHNPYRDYEPSYFIQKQDEISRLVDIRIRQRSHADRINHLSIFALASMPLLIHFGYEMGDTVPSDVYQPHRDVSNPWKWQGKSEQEFKYIIESPLPLEIGDSKVIALNLSLSDLIHPDVISQVLKEQYGSVKAEILVE